MTPIMRFWWLGTVSVVAMIFLITTMSGERAAAQQQSEKIDASILEGLAASRDGEVPIIVHLTDQVDRSLFAPIPDEILSKEELIALRQNLYTMKTAIANASRAILEPFLQTQRASKVKFYWIFNGFTATVDVHALQAIARRPEVARIFYDEIASVVTHNPGDAQPTQNVQLVTAPQAWGSSTGANSVIGIIDTGVFLQHRALEEHYRGFGGSHNYNWFDFVNGQQAPYDDFVGFCGFNCGHGTAVTGAAVSYNSTTQNWHFGVSPAAKWIAVKAFDSSGAAPSSRIFDSMQWMLAPTRLDGSGADPSQAPDIVNGSFSLSSCTEILRPAVQAYVNARIIPIFTAGNSGPGSGTVLAPGCYPESLAVGATDQNDVIASFSSRGPSLFGVIEPDLVAPGVSVQLPCACGNDVWVQLSGTSFSAPHITGAAALLTSVYSHPYPNSVYRCALKTTALDLGDAGPDNTYGWGRLNNLPSAVWIVAVGRPRYQICSNYLD